MGKPNEEIVYHSYESTELQNLIEKVESKVYSEEVPVEEGSRALTSLLSFLKYT